MARPICTICLLPKNRRTAIDRALADGHTLAAVAAKFSTPENSFTYGSVNRHRRHVLAPGTVIQHQQRPKAEPKVQRTLQARIEELVDRFEGIAAAGEETGQLMTATAALKELHACLKTIGQLSGELTTATINFNLFNFATLREEQIIAFLDGIENGPPLAVARVRQLVIERLGPPHPIIQVQFRAPDYQPAAVELPRKVDDAIVR